MIYVCFKFLFLQLALAISREDAEQEESKSKSDDMRLQLALQKSKEQSKDGEEAPAVSEGDSKPITKPNSKPSNDLLDLDFGSPVAQPPPPERTIGKSDLCFKISTLGAKSTATDKFF